MTNQLLITTVLDSNPFCRFPLIINYFLENNKLKDAPPSSRLLTHNRNRIETDRSYLRFFQKKKKKIKKKHPIEAERWKRRRLLLRLRRRQRRN